MQKGELASQLEAKNILCCQKRNSERGWYFQESKNSGVTGVEEARRVGSWQDRTQGWSLIPECRGLGNRMQEPRLDPESNRKPVEVWGEFLSWLHRSGLGLEGSPG